MVDPIQYSIDKNRERNVLDMDFESDNVRLVDHDCCDKCRAIIESETRPFKFSGYSKINPLTEAGLTDHQYFLCDRSFDAFAFKHREWSKVVYSFDSCIADFFRMFRRLWY
jgi:hypothetical protein